MFTLHPPPESSFRMSGGNPPNFDCVVSRSGRHAAWIRVGGELDLVSARELRQALHEVLEDERMIVVDLRGLTFMDSAGIHAILDADTRARRRGARLVLIRGPAQIDRLFELLGITDHLEIVDVHGS